MTLIFIIFIIINKMKQQITENKENLFFGIKIAWMSVVTLKRRPQKIIQV